MCTVKLVKLKVERQPKPAENLDWTRTVKLKFPDLCEMSRNSNNLIGDKPQSFLTLKVFKRKMCICACVTCVSEWFDDSTKIVRIPTGD